MIHFGIRGNQVSHTARNLIYANSRFPGVADLPIDDFPRFISGCAKACGFEIDGTDLRARRSPAPHDHNTSVRVSGRDANDAVPLKVSDTVKLLVGDSAGQMGVVSEVGADGQYEVDEQWFERSELEFQH